jgi:hypothetical protein
VSGFARLATCVALALALSGCASGDFGRPRSAWFTDEGVAVAVGGPLRAVPLPINVYGYTDDEKRLRRYAYPLLVPPFQKELLLKLPIDFDYPAAIAGLTPGYGAEGYGDWLLGFPVRSQVARYSRLIDDTRDDVIRIDNFYAVAQRVADMDRRREQSLAHVSAASDFDRANATARIAENGELILRVYTCLGVRVTAYRGALERVVLAQPSPMAADADRAISALQGKVTMIGAVAQAPQPLALVSKQ